MRLLAIFLGLATSFVACLRPTPQIRTAVQAAVWSRKARLAANLSANAIPSLLAHLGSNRSRTLLSVDCPELANATAERILARLLAEFEVAELVESLGGGHYQTLPQLFETNFLYNLWETQFNFTKPKCKNSWDYNEREIFGLPAFTHCPPTNWTEAQNRLYYVSLNYQKLPLGFAFTDISLVFNRTYARNLTLVAPVDTGHWSHCASKPNQTKPMNCTGWDHSVGTLADLNHMFLAAYYLQRGPVSPGAFFPRIDCTSAATGGGGTRVIGNGLPYSSITEFPYFESNILGSVNFPAGVSHVLAPLLTYWGTSTGRALQAWCARWGFPLLWTPCAAGSRYKCQSGSPRRAWRVLDPKSVNHTRLNVTVRADQTADAARMWALVSALPSNTSKAARLEVLDRVWTNLTLATSLLVRPLSAGDCGRPDECIGVQLRLGANVTRVGSCVCRV